MIHHAHTVAGVHHTYSHATVVRSRAPVLLRQEPQEGYGKLRADVIFLAELNRYNSKTEGRVCQNVGVMVKTDNGNINEIAKKYCFTYIRYTFTVDLF